MGQWALVMSSLGAHLWLECLIPLLLNVPLSFTLSFLIFFKWINDWNRETWSFVTAAVAFLLTQKLSLAYARFWEARALTLPLPLPLTLPPNPNPNLNPNPNPNPIILSLTLTLTHNPNPVPNPNPNPGPRAPWGRSQVLPVDLGDGQATVGARPPHCRRGCR
jgi:hypothetical protein